MSFSKANPRASNNVMCPRRDRSIEATRSKAPPVPRAPRAQSKPHSAGALARDMWSGKNNSPSANSLLARSSEHRRPRDESPFARINALSRETDATENQQFSFGPGRRPPSAERRSFERGHILGKETSAQAGIHWSTVTAGEQPDARVPTKRNALAREAEDAEQHLDWVPQAARGASRRAGTPTAERDFSRRNVLAREQTDGEDHPDKMQSDKGGGNYGRKRVLHREREQDAGTLNMPKPSGVEGSGAPCFRRKSQFEHVAGIGGS